MSRLLINELKYYKFPLVLMLVLFLIYTPFALLDFQILTSPEFEIDYWGGIYSLILYSYIIIVWGNRIRENRIRMQVLLPVPLKVSSMSRFWLASIHYFAILVYLIIVHLIMIDNWHMETGSMLGQIGVTFILLAGFIRGRDDWFSHWNFGKRTSSAFVSVLIIQVVVVAVFTIKPGLNKSLVEGFGPDAFNYASLIFPLLGLIILITTIFSFQKRKSFLQ